MKIGENEYFCPWCETKFNKIVNKYTKTEGKGKKNVTAQCVCQKCNRYVSQKTKVNI